MVADLTCPFCGGPADGYDVDHVAQALFAEVSERLDNVGTAWLVFTDFIAVNFDDMSEETKAAIEAEASRMGDRLAEVFDTQPE